MLFCVMLHRLDVIAPRFAQWREHWRVLFLSRSLIVLLTKLFAWVLFAFGLLTIITTVRIVIRTYSPVLFWDQWQIIHTLMESGGHPSLRQLWAQHNEHRLLMGRLLGFIDLFFFRGRNVSLFAEILVVQLCHVILLAFVLRRFGRLPWPVYVTLVGFVAYCLFSPLQMENFDWAFQIVFVLANFAASVCFATALWYSQQNSTSNSWRKFLALMLCLFAAFVSEASEAYGLLVWPVLLFLSFALRFRWRDRWIIAVASSAACHLPGRLRIAKPSELANERPQPATGPVEICSYLPGQQLGRTFAQ